VIGQLHALANLKQDISQFIQQLGDPKSHYVDKRSVPCLCWEATKDLRLSTLWPSHLLATPT